MPSRTALPGPPPSLCHVRTTDPGIVRVRHGRGFRYLWKGRAVRDPGTLKRIKALAIPPAWINVWICADPRGHLQAVGTDQRGRRQYRYHVDWSARRGRAKYDHVLRFGAQLPRMRQQLHRHLALKGLPREKVLATVVAVMDATSMRIGQAAYTRANGSHGLSTLHDRHVRRDGSGVRFVFKGKSGVQRDIRLESRRLARLVLRCKELPGQDLFQYVDEEGTPRPIHSGMVNDHIRTLTTADFSCKDVRTWRGTVHAVQAFLDLPVPTSSSSARQAVNSAMDRVAAELGNTRAVCRKYYVHPTIIDLFCSGRLHDEASGLRASRWMTREERLVLRALRAGTRA